MNIIQFIQVVSRLVSLETEALVPKSPRVRPPQLLDGIPVSLPSRRIRAHDAPELLLCHQVLVHEERADDNLVRRRINLVLVAHDEPPSGDLDHLDGVRPWLLPAGTFFRWSSRCI